MESVNMSMNLDSEASSNEEITQPRPSKASKLRRSCELCRSHKARCNPSEGNSDRCHRCTRDGKECVFLAAKARPKRAKNSKARVAEMEQKLDGLMALLNSQGRALDPTPSITPPPVDQLDCDNFDEPSSILLNMSNQRHQILSNPHQFSLFSLPKSNVDIVGDVISKDIISYDLAAEYLQYYRTKSKYFPFVIISPHESLDSLRRERPFLLLAVLAMSAILSSTKLQKTLDLELRENLSRRTIVNGEKSLDLLQGLLVYLVWYHFFFEPRTYLKRSSTFSSISSRYESQLMIIKSRDKVVISGETTPKIFHKVKTLTHSTLSERQQIYQLSQMAITLAIDLGINKPTKTPTCPNLNPIDLICPMPGLESPNDPEVRRALLGVYYLTSAVCHSLRKPNNMRYSDYIGECCSYFAQNPATDTDHLLQYIVRLQHFQEEVNAAFDYDSTYNLQTLDSPRIEILLNTFKRQLTEFEQTFPPEVWECAQITTTFYSLKIYLYEIGFHAKPPLPIHSLNVHSRDWYNSTARTESLFACLQACKDYLDRVLLLDGQVFISLALPDFVRLIYVLLILGSFACLSDYPQIQALANLQYFLSAFQQKTSGIIQTSHTSIAGCFIHLNRLFEQTSAWHSKTMADSTFLGKCLIWHPQFNVPDMLPDAMERVVGYRDLFEEDAMGGLMLWGGMQVDVASELNIPWTGDGELDLDGGDQSGVVLDEGDLGLGGGGVGLEL